MNEGFQRHVVSPFAPNLASGLHLACELGIGELFGRLLAVDDPTTRERMVRRQDSMRHTPLHLAVISGQMPIIKVLLEAGALCNAVSIINASPFHLAVLLSRHEIAMAILDKAADKAELANTATVSSDQASTAYTELRFPIFKGVITPLEPKVWLNVHGRTALITAARNNNVDMVRAL